MELEKWEDSPMSGDRGESDFVVGDVDPVDRTLQLTGTPTSGKSTFSYQAVRDKFVPTIANREL